MISENQYVTKGIYRRAQIGGLVSVKNYIFVRDGDRKGLLLRFCNELGYPVSGLSYTVVQYGADGNEVGRTRVRHRALHVLPGEDYSPETAVSVDERCADFRVVFSEVISDRYRYAVRGETVAVYYTMENGSLLANEEESLPAEDGDICSYSVERKSFGDAFRARLAVILAVLLVIALNAGYLLFSYGYLKLPEKKEKESGIASESTDMKWNDGEQYVEI